MTIKFLLVFWRVFFLILQNTSAQNPDIIWSKSYGGSDLDVAGCIHQTTDGGFIVGGFAQSDDGDVSGNHGYEDYWVLKLDAFGNIEWKKTLGGSYFEILSSIRQTSDHGYILCGFAQSNDGDVTGIHGLSDVWIIKLDSAGSIQWKKCYGGSGYDQASDIIVVNGGYIFSGLTNSIDGDVSFNHGGQDVWIVRLNDTGSIIWEKTYGGSYDDEGVTLVQTTDSAFIIGAETHSSDGDAANNNYHGGFDFWILKIDGDGVLQWSKCYGGTYTEYLYSIAQTDDGGYVCGGISTSIDGDVTGNHGGTDYWIVKVNSTGAIEWQKSLGGTKDDQCYGIEISNDQGILAIGYTVSNDGDVTYNHALDLYSDVWLVKLNGVGDIQWQRSYGGTNGDGGGSIIQLQDGSYVFVGSSSSSDDDVLFNNGSGDYWIVKLSASTSASEIPASQNFSIYPNPSSRYFYFQSHSRLPCRIELTDALGKIISQKNCLPAETLTIDAGNNPKGVYIFKIINRDGLTTKKIVLE